MISDLTIDPFLDELISVYTDIYQAFDPYWHSIRELNPQYRKAYKFFNGERDKLHQYLTEGLFVDAKSKSRVIETLDKAIELLPLIDNKPIYRDKVTTPAMILGNATRIRDIAYNIDVLNDD